MKTLKKTAAVLLLLALCLFGCAAPKEAAAPEAPIRALLEKIYNGPDETITKRLAERSSPGRRPFPRRSSRPRSTTAARHGPRRKSSAPRARSISSRTRCS